jgi:hypothetical protein
MYKNAGKFHHWYTTTRDRKGKPIRPVIRPNNPKRQLLLKKIDAEAAAAKEQIGRGGAPQLRKLETVTSKATDKFSRRLKRSQTY